MNTQHPKRPNPRQVAHANELATLLAVRSYGHLRRSEIATAIWLRSGPGVAEKGANRTVRRLLDDGELIERTNALGGLSVLLSSKGAARLRAEGHKAKPGYGITSVAGPTFWHRTLTTAYLVRCLGEGRLAFGEYAVTTGLGPVGRGELQERFSKLPDGLVLTRTKHQTGLGAPIYLADWVEVESARKDIDQLQAMFRLMDRWGGQWLNVAETVVLQRLVLVYSSRQAHERAILRALRAYLAMRPDWAGCAEIELLPRIALVRCEVGLPLVWRGCEEVAVAELL